MYVETGIPLRVPYRSATTIAGAEKDLAWWNRYCTVNWSAYKFSKLFFHNVDPGSVIVDKFYVDIDLYHGDELVNPDTAKKAELFLDKKNICRLWVITQHGYNLYLKAPPGCSMDHVENLFRTFSSMDMDIDPCMMNPVAHRKAINSVIHESGTIAMPIFPHEVKEPFEDVLEMAKVQRSITWTGDDAVTPEILMWKVVEPVKKASLINADELPWPILPTTFCPTILFVLNKKRVTFYEMVDVVKYMRAVARIPTWAFERVLERITNWNPTSNWWDVVSQGYRDRVWFSPNKLKAIGYCPDDCYQCVLKQKANRT